MKATTRWVMWIGLLGSAPTAWAADGDAAVPKTTYRVELTPSSMPPTRTICEVRTDSTTSSVEWDPATRSQLRQRVFLPTGESLRNTVVQCWSDVPSMSTDLQYATYWDFGPESRLDLAAADQWSRKYTMLNEMADILGDAATAETTVETERVHREWEDTKLKYSDLSASLPAQDVDFGKPDTLKSAQDTFDKKIKEQWAKAPTIDPRTVTVSKGAIRTIYMSKDTTKSINESAAPPVPTSSALPQHQPSQTPPSPQQSAASNGPATVCRAPSCTGSPQITVRVVSQTPKLTERLHTLDTQSGASSENRSLFGPVSKVVTDTAKVLGEIALKRAEARAREIMMDRLMGQICDDGVQISERWVKLRTRDLDQSLNWSKTKHSPIEYFNDELVDNKSPDAPPEGLLLSLRSADQHKFVLSCESNAEKSVSRARVGAISAEAEEKRTQGIAKVTYIDLTDSKNTLATAQQTARVEETNLKTLESEAKGLERSAASSSNANDAMAAQNARAKADDAETLLESAKDKVDDLDNEVREATRQWNNQSDSAETSRLASSLAWFGPEGIEITDQATLLASLSGPASILPSANAFSDLGSRIQSIHRKISLVQSSFGCAASPPSPACSSLGLAKDSVLNAMETAKSTSEAIIYAETVAALVTKFPIIDTSGRLLERSKDSVRSATHSTITATEAAMETVRIAANQVLKQLDSSLAVVDRPTVETQNAFDSARATLEHAKVALRGDRRVRYRIHTSTWSDSQIEVEPACDPWMKRSIDPEVNVVLSAPSSPPLHEHAIIALWQREQRAPTRSLAGGWSEVRQVLSLKNTCDLIKERPFADIARSGAHLARALQADLLTSSLNYLSEVKTENAALTNELEGTIKPLLDTVLPPLVDAVRGGHPPTGRDAQAMIAALRQLLKEQAERPAGSKKECVAGHEHLQIALGILADCIEHGSCDLRQVAAKVAAPRNYFDISKATCGTTVAAGGAGSGSLPQLTASQQRDLVRIIDQFYTVFAPSPNITDTERATAAVRALFDVVSFAVNVSPKGQATTGAGNGDAGRREVLLTVLDNLKRLTLAGIEEDLAKVAKEATSLVGSTIRLIAFDAQCSPTDGATRGDESRECVDNLGKAAKRLSKVLPWITTLVAHAEQIKDERNQDLTEAEIEKLSDARKVALEELIDSSTRRKGREGDWVVGLGANVGLRTAFSFPRTTHRLPLQPTSTVKEDQPWRFIDTPLTLPIGLAIQWLPHPVGKASTVGSRQRDRNNKILDSLRETGAPPKGSPFGVGLHMQFSAVDVGQFVIASEDITTMTWNEFLIANAQLGIMLNTARDAMTISADYRYAPAVGVQGAHQFGLVFTYYVPFLDFN